MASQGPLPTSQILQAIEGVMKILGSLLGGSKDKSEAADSGNGKPPDKPPPELVDIADGDDELAASMQLMRDDLAKFGTSLGAIATGIIGALGYTRFNDIFPFPLGAPGWLGPATVAAATCGLGATTFLVFRFFFARRRIILDPPEPPRGANGEPDANLEPTARPWQLTKKLIIKRTQPYAIAEGEKSLWAVDQHQVELEKLAHKKEPTGAANSEEWKETYRLQRVVDLAIWDASCSVLERRTRGTVGGPVATLAIILAVGGIGFTFATADWAKGRRTLPEQRVRESQVCLAQARASTVQSDIDALVQACLSKAKLDLGSTVSTVTVTTTTPSK